MARKLVNVDPRDIERAARGVPGVAFAEVSDEGGRAVLRVVVWHDAPAEDTAARVELSLRESLGLDIEGGDIRLAGVANPSEVHSGPDSGIRVIDLGGKTWATEDVQPIPPSEPLSMGAVFASRASLVSVAVTRTGNHCTARVEVDAGGTVRSAESSGPATDARMRRAVCEAASVAACSALDIHPLDVEHAETCGSADACALVILAAPGEPPQRRAGAALVSGDPWYAFALATLQAAVAFAR